jgi:cobyrinic acid a,c-diamide synthase
MAARLDIPRVVIGAIESGAGKTTATVAIAAALRARGLKLAMFKCGPDYLDPSYHRRAARIESHNLDGWMMGREAVWATFARAAAGCDLAIIEGMMGLFDGAEPDGDDGSTAQIAKWLGAPVIAVVNASGMARTIAAIANGLRSFDPELHLAGLICNRIGGRTHLEILRAACADPPIVGGLPETAGANFPERHLGLVSALDAPLPDAIFERWAEIGGDWLDLDAMLRIARAAPPIENDARAEEVADAHRNERAPVRIGIAFDEAFHFYYEDNLNRLKALGAELDFFSPVHDTQIPACDGLYFGGGYPEIVAERLSSNRAMLDSIREFARRGGPIYAECGGLMYLSRAIRTLDGRSWPMAGLIAAEAVMAERLAALGYAEVTTRAASILGPAGLSFRGHQFRYSTLTAVDQPIERIYQVKSRWGAPFDEGFRAGNLLASYVHAHWASNPRAAAGFVDSCRGWRAG